MGRHAELELYRAALDADDPQFCVLFIHGPSGVGKSALLDEYAALSPWAQIDSVITNMRPRQH